MTKLAVAVATDMTNRTAFANDELLSRYIQLVVEGSVGNSPWSLIQVCHQACSTATVMSTRELN